jgi:hypothetical protein
MDAAFLDTVFIREFLSVGCANERFFALERKMTLVIPESVPGGTAKIIHPDPVKSH